MKEIEGTLRADGLRLAIVVARFNGFITEPLLSGAVDAFVRHGGSRSDVTVIRVPGGFEIPLACKRVAELSTVDGVVALGAVIRGATDHYDYVCREVSSGIAKVALETGVPISFGVLTVDSIEQAIERAGTKSGNKGAEAAVAAIEMVQVLRQLKSQEG